MLAFQSLLFPTERLPFFIKYTVVQERSSGFRSGFIDRLLVKAYNIIKSPLYSFFSNRCVFYTHLNELPISRPNKENHPGLVSHCQHRGHVVLPEEHLLGLQDLWVRNTVLISTGICGFQVRNNKC